MKRITNLAYLEKVYAIMINFLKFTINRERYNSSIKVLSQICLFMYKYNLSFEDETIENYMQLLAEKIIKCEKKDSCVISKKIIFYDYFAWDERGLTLIYLDALLQKNYQVVYITRSCNDNYKMQRIKSILGKSKIIFIDDMLPTTIQTDQFSSIISNENPESILVHSAPWDIIGMLPLYHMNRKIKRYMINITDHAFWVGIAAIDYVIEFRNYGYNISNTMRGISKDKLLLLPYYSFKTEHPFRGFPFQLCDKDKLIFSGGSLYKINESPVFFNIVKHILNMHSETKFLYVGNGDDKKFKKFITDNKFEGRCFLMQERDDLDEIMKRCYFYLSTFPMIGGLMSHYAVKNGKIPISLMLENDYNNFQEDLFINCNNVKLTYTTLEDLLEEIDKIITDKSYYNEKNNQLSDILIKPEKFAEELNRALTTHETCFSGVKRGIDFRKIRVRDIRKLNIKSLSDMFLKSCWYVLKSKIYN